MSHTISENKAPDFIEQAKLAALYLECEGKFLFLRSATPAYVAGKWGVPGGKVNEEESVEAAALRELKEKTGIEARPNEIKLLRPLYVTAPKGSFGFYIHVMSLKEIPKIVLSDEHDQFTWVVESEFSKLDMMPGSQEPFQHVQRHFVAKSAS